MADLVNAVMKLGANTGALALVQEYWACRTAEAEQQTEQDRILARRDVALQALANEREVILDYFSKRFAERRSALDESFALLHAAVETRNDKGIDAALSSVVSIVSANPLSDFEAFKKARVAGQIIEI
jgi:hypothetical protein